MIGFLVNIEEKAKANKYFREVLYTGQHSQLVVMSILPEDDIGEEVHEVVDQFIRIEEGEGKVLMDGEEHSIKDGDAFIVPAGTKHNVINTSSKKPLKLYTIYSPPHHKDKTIHKTKSDAFKDSEDHI